MDRLMTADDVAQALNVSRRTAYTYMAEMIHLTRPLRVAESSFREWIFSNTTAPGSKPKRKSNGRKNGFYRIPTRKT